MAIDKNTVMKEAQKLIARGQFDKAIAEWKKLIKETPNDANIYNTIGDLCLKKNAKAEAVDAYSKAADILTADGFTSKAIALYKKVLNIDPKKIETHLALGDLNAEKGLTGNALESYKIAADHFTQKKDAVKALGIYQKMADLNPANVAFRIKLGDMYAKEAMTAEAASAYLGAAEVHMSKEAYKDARQLFEKVLALDPDNKEVYFKAGVVYFKEGKYNEACKALKPAFEKDPSNRELADTYIEALTKAGRDGDAEQVMKNILAEDAGREDLSEKLYHSFLSKKEYGQALELASALADAAAQRGEHKKAEEMLKDFIAAGPHFLPGRQKLAEYYLSVERKQDAGHVFLQAAEMSAGEGDTEGARAALLRVLEITPGLQKALDLLDRLSHPEPVSAPPQEREAPVSTADAAGFEPVVPVIEEPAAAPVESLALEAPAPQEEPAPKAEEMEDPAVSEALTEADVLIKYGLATKAAEHLEGLAKRFPESIPVRIKLRDVYGDMGLMSKAVAHMLVLAGLYAKRGMQDDSRQMLQSAFEMDPKNAQAMSLSGIPPSPAAVASAGITEPEERAFETRESDEPALETPASPDVPPSEFVPEVTTTPPAGEEALPAFDEAPSFPEPASAEEILFDHLEAGIPRLEEDAPFTEAPNASEMPVAEPEPRPFTEEAALIEEAPAEVESPATEAGSRSSSAEEASAFEDQLAAFETPGEPLEQDAATPEELSREPAADVDTGEVWAEAEFYYQQGLFEEAKKHYAKILELNPGEGRAVERLAEISREEEETKEFSRLAEAVEGLEDTLASGPAERELPLSTSDTEAVRSLMSEIAQLKMPIKETPPPPRPAPKPVEKGVTDASTAAEKPVAEEDFFDLGAELAAESRAAAPRMREMPSDDFFDLAAELRDELSNVAAPAPRAGQDEEQSLDEIFDEFKKGVELQSVREDVDTHYNLGVAYKEMGLLDDAIGEFILTPEDEPKYIQSRYMLGLCYMEKGEYQQAIGEIGNAVACSETPGGGRQGIGMHYDLGLAYQGAGNISAALSEFQIVSQMDSRYRDVGAKLKVLKKGDIISLNQLKDDIEREISEKFFEEGERIEREEKTRKNEKVRS
jgi:tetratricopeptide (TPR) repeat protein